MLIKITRPHQNNTSRLNNRARHSEAVLASLHLHLLRSIDPMQLHADIWGLSATKLGANHNSADPKNAPARFCGPYAAARSQLMPESHRNRVKPQQRGSTPETHLLGFMALTQLDADIWGLDARRQRGGDARVAGGHARLDASGDAVRQRFRCRCESHIFQEGVNEHPA
eukprot:1161761-Pelagomonas_calceolata.AAC.2